MPRGRGKKPRTGGVMRTIERQRNKDAWVGYWFDQDGIIHRRRFSIRKYGDTEARNRAARAQHEGVSHISPPPIPSHMAMGEERVIRILGHDAGPGSRRKYRVEWADHSVTMEPRRNLVDKAENGGEFIVNEALQKYWDRNPNLSRKV
jgi:hypothetical protein